MIGEFDIIARYFTRASGDADVVLGIGDDAAVLAVDGDVAVTVDTLVAGVHFPDGTAPNLLGYRLMAVNLSDLAAMGASPRWCTLALTLPSADELWLDGFSRGLFELADRYGVSLVGGNLTRGPLSLTLQLIGKIQRANLLTRGGGHVGDDIYVTGTLGDSAAGIALILERSAAPQGSAASGAEAALLPPRAPRRGRARPRAARNGGDRRLGRPALGLGPHLHGERLRRHDRRRARAVVGRAIVAVSAAGSARARARRR